MKQKALYVLPKNKLFELIKGKIDKSKEQTKCRMCNRNDEAINHTVSECPKLIQKEYNGNTNSMINDWINNPAWGLS